MEDGELPSEALELEEEDEDLALLARDVVLPLVARVGDDPGPEGGGLATELDPWEAWFWVSAAFLAFPLDLLELALTVADTVL